MKRLPLVVPISTSTSSWIGTGIAFFSLVAYDVYYYQQLQKEVLEQDFKPFSIAAIRKVNHDTSLYSIRAKCKDWPLFSHILIKDDSCQIARA